MAILNNSNAISTGGYDINNSLRLRSSASAYLNRTPASAGNRRTFTYSAWVKIGTISTWKKMLSVWNANTDAGYFDFGINNNNNFVIQGWNTAWRISTQVFRDPSAWYHIVVAVDTTQATAANRIKLYVNGNEVTVFSSSSNPTQNYDFLLNSTVATYIGTDAGGVGTSNFDGYQAEINFIDGSAKTPSDFGETDATTGVWKPKAYTGTYGTNGFYLKFSDIATTSGSNAGLGKDFSGNTNYWTTNNISVTAGTTYDAMKDSPTNTSATVANYAVMNPLWKDGTTVIAQGNLNVSNGNYGGFSTLTIPTNSKFYAEFTVTETQGNQGVGILKAANAYSGVISQADMFSSNSVTYYSTNGNKFVLGGGSTAYGSSWGTIGDVIGIAVNTVDNQITFYKNNTSQGVITGLTSGIEWVFATGNQTNTGGGAWNFGQRPFSYTPPTGYVALNTYNLPTPTILQGNKYMDATTYTGNGSSQVIVNQGQFKPDLVWNKNRGTTSTSHGLFDSVRGTTAYLISNSTNAEANLSGVTSFNSNGFSLGSEWNQSANTFVSWQWQAGQGTNTTNTSGTITSTVSVNTTAGFSVVTYTGTGSAATVGHGLGVAPKFLIVKNRVQGTYGNWNVWHTTLTGSQYLSLNLTDAASTNNNRWNGTVPTSTVFSVGTDSFGNTNKSGDTYVAYCWADVSGFSRFGSYTGNGSADGPMIYLGFRPKFVLFKMSSGTTAGSASWRMIDTSRSTYNVLSETLFPNLSNAETSGSSSYYMDILSNGFKVRTSDTGANESGSTFIYMAFAESPFSTNNRAR